MKISHDFNKDELGVIYNALWNYEERLMDDWHYHNKYGSEESLERCNRWLIALEKMTDLFYIDHNE